MATWFLVGRRLVWHALPRSAWTADVVMAELNPRILSTWALLLARRLMPRRRTILWGHAWPRRGRGARTDGLRHLQRRLASSLVTYTEQQRLDLARRMPRKHIIAAPNALYRKETMAPKDPSTEATDFVYVGRLVEQKKPRLLVEAFLAARDELPAGTRLVIVGDGPLRAELEQRCAGAPQVVFRGHVGDEDVLADIYARAIASVSPGYVGLSITQSLGFGVPMIVADDEPHSPEIEAAVEGRNAMFFTSGSVDALRHALLAVAKAREAWMARRAAISNDAAARYSVEAMVERLVTAFVGVETGLREA
jgi:glycosyltransferase involved in cell wall biosynthesis